MSELLLTRASSLCAVSRNFNCQTMWGNFLVLYLLFLSVWKYRLLILGTILFLVWAMDEIETAELMLRRWRDLAHRVCKAIVESPEISDIFALATAAFWRWVDYLRPTGRPPRAPPRGRRSRPTPVSMFQMFITGMTPVDPWRVVFPNINKHVTRDLPSVLGAAQYDAFYKFVEESVSPARLLEFVCPISKEIMAAPVVASDGSCYDAQSIFEWIRHHCGPRLAPGAVVPSPLTGVNISATSFYPNNNVRSAILAKLDEFRRSCPAPDCAAAETGSSFFSRLLRKS